MTKRTSLSRRDFLKLSSAATTGLMLAGNTPFAFGTEDSIKMTQKKMEQMFHISPQDARRAVELMLGRGADYGELYLEDAVSTGINMEDGKIRNVSYLEDSGAGLRAALGDTQAYGYTQRFDPGELNRVAKQVGAVSQAEKPSITIKPENVVQPVSGLYSADDPSVHKPPKGKLELLERADKAARAFDPAVKRVDVYLSENLRIIGLYNSLGQMYVEVLPMIRFGVSVIAEKDGKKQRSHIGGGGREGLEYFNEVSPEEIGKESARIAVKMLDARPAPAGEQTVVLAPSDSGILLHEAVGHGLEGDFNRRGTSRYSGEVGNKVASELCTVVDDGTIPKSRGSIGVDDEGCVAKRNVLIENGVLKGYMQDRLSAKHFKVPQSGNGRRQSYRHMPVPRMTNTYMLEGKSDPEEIIKNTKKGVYCQTFSGGQVNISNGDFVFQVVESYLIEEGKITAPLKDVVIIGNGPDALGKVSMVGNDLQFSDGRWTCGKAGQRVPVGVGIPTVKVDGITVGGTK